MTRQSTSLPSRAASLSRERDPPGGIDHAGDDELQPALEVISTDGDPAQVADLVDVDVPERDMSDEGLVVVVGEVPARRAMKVRLQLVDFLCLPAIRSDHHRLAQLEPEHPVAGLDLANIAPRDHGFG